MRRAQNDITILTRGRGESGSGILRSAEASGDPSIRAEETDLSIDAKNTMIASDRTGGSERNHGPVGGDSQASEEPEIKNRGCSSGGLTGSGGDHSVVGDSAWQRPCQVAVPPGGRRRISGSPSSR